jgi:predicted DNA repair protein MutK
MAGGSLLTLFDDVTTLLDDVALLTKTTTQKTAGVLGDDLALNAEQVSGVRAERELPVVWAVAKGSLKNKAILVPGAMLISALAPWAITPILMVGGAYLCLEGFEKIAHKYLDHSADDAADAEEAKAAMGKSPAELERQKINGAVRTDLILSMEIMAIALGAVAGASLLNQFLVLSAVALLVTVGVYGLVALIVRMDDVGFYLEKKQNQVAKAVGRKIIQAAPILMKLLTIIGTCAMFLVGAGIILHGIPVLSDLKHSIEHAAEALPVVGGVMKVVTPVILDGVAGVLIGALVLAVVTQFQKVIGLFKKSAK